MPSNAAAAPKNARAGSTDSRQHLLDGMLCRNPALSDGQHGVTHVRLLLVFRISASMPGPYMTCTPPTGTGTGTDTVSRKRNAMRPDPDADQRPGRRWRGVYVYCMHIYAVRSSLSVSRPVRVLSFRLKTSPVRLITL